MRKEEAGYRRILVVNDNDSREEFLKKYRGLGDWEEELFYCGNMNDALRCLERNGLFCCDKILLDIHMEWCADEQYESKVRHLIDVDRMEKEYGGFILYMYLLARGFPIDRIAFFSAYVTEEDSEKPVKKEILDYLRETCKVRTKETDRELREKMERVPSQKANMLRILEAWSDSTRKRKRTPYDQIERLLERDLETNVTESVSGKGSETEENKAERAKTAARSFFDRVKSTGLIVQKKIHKGNTEGLLSWIGSESEEEIRRYYHFRTAALNVCDWLTAYYSGTDMDKNKGIYLYVNENQRKIFYDKYPPQYFEGILSNIKNALALKTDGTSVREISDRVVNILISCWEGLHESRDQDREHINEFAVAMTLKFTRNWKMHNLIKDPDVVFMAFIFALSAFALGYREEELSILISGLTDKGKSREKTRKTEDLAEHLLTAVNKALGKSVYVLSLADLYGEYGRNNRTRIQIQTADLYELYWLCLHFPYISDRKRLSFTDDACQERHELLGMLSDVALEKIRMPRLPSTNIS